MNFKKIFCLMFLFSIFNVNSFGLAKSQKATSIDIAGKGIGARLHQPIAKEIGISAKFINTSDTINKPSDTLIIATPPQKHIGCLIWAVSRYKKILCEKPAGISLSDISKLENYIEKNNIDSQIRVNYQLRFHPIFKKMSEFTKNNKIKNLVITYKSNFGNGKPDKTWKESIETGGGIIFSILPHILDAINFLDIDIQNKPTWFKTNDIENIPIKNINICFNESKCNIPTVLIDSDVSTNYDEFTFKFETENGTQKIFDLIENGQVSSKNNRYDNGYLLSKNEYSFWRSCFKNLLSTFLYDIDDHRLAKISDAKKVLQICDFLTENLNSK